MTNKEFSDGFDILLNSYNLTINNVDIRDIKLDDYEKSLYLTEAQENLVKGYYSGKNIFMESFEQTEEITRALDALLKTISISETTDSDKITGKSYIFTLPSDLWFIVYEKAIFDTPEIANLNNKEVAVIPVGHTDIWKEIDNPFKGPSENRVLRINKGSNKAELISDYKVKTYQIRYVSHPSPIVLVTLPAGLSVDGTNAETQCSLNSLLHRKILQDAVNIAIQRKAVAYIGNKK